jgi:hypothetical protein
MRIPAQKYDGAGMGMTHVTSLKAGNSALNYTRAYF